MMENLRIVALFTVTAIAEIAGCYLPYLWLRNGKSILLLIPAGFSLGLFVWLLTLHPSLPAGRTYAAYGGIYVSIAVLWLWQVDGIKPDRWDIIGVVVTIIGMTIIAFAPHKV